MSLTTASIGLADGLKTTGTIWEEVRASWEDAVAQEFEANQWVPLKNQVEATLAALERLAPILARAQQDCA